MTRSRAATASEEQGEQPAGRDLVGARPRKRPRRGGLLGVTRRRLGVGKTGVRPLRGEPERALMRAVLADAIRCLAGSVSPLSVRAQLAAKARVWVKTRDAGWPFSFENVCQGLGLEPGPVRARLLGPQEAVKAVHERLEESVLAP